jgi:hypothetical protein
MRATFAIEKLSKVNNRPLGENSPNLVTLVDTRKNGQKLVPYSTALFDSFCRAVPIKNHNSIQLQPPPAILNSCEKSF